MNRKSRETLAKDMEESTRSILSRFPSVLQLGTLCFDASDGQSSQETKPFMRAVPNVSIEDCVHQIFHKQWKLKQPRIVVLIISNVEPLKEWTNERQLKHFQSGIISAAQNTNMWLLCNGINMGSTALIGDAVSNEISEAKYKKITEKSKSKFTVIGIADEDMLRYGPSLVSSEQRFDVPKDSNSGGAKYGLNPNLTHYVVIKDETQEKSGVNSFITNLMSFLSTIGDQKISEVSGNESTTDLCSLRGVEVPVISLLIRGDYNCSQLVEQQIKNGIPVVVLRGSGGLADLLGFVDSEIRERCLNVWDTEFCELYLKPELRIKITQYFPKLKDPKIWNSFVDRILNCVRESRKEGVSECLHIINLFEYSCNLENLTEKLLSALIKSQHSMHSMSKTISNIASKVEDKPNIELIKKELHLCIDWNCPEVAKREVLSKDPSFSLNSEKKLFEESLTQANRREFIDLFLSQKFKLRAFVSEKRLSRMFRRLHSRHFFKSVCWEGILGREPNSKGFDQLIQRELNWLIEACTGFRNFCDVEELNYFVMGQYPNSESEAERKCLAIIVFWALLDFRSYLVQVLWKHSDQPIQLALVIAMVYERLSSYVSEQTLHVELKQESARFVNYAYNALDVIYNDSADRAEQVLNESTKDWDYKSAVDLAAIAKFRSFLGHPSCQRWLTHIFYGKISLIDLQVGFFRLPALLKILLSAFLFFPMYFWIKFELNSPSVEVLEEENLEEDEDVSELKTNNEEKKTSDMSRKDNKQNKDSFIIETNIDKKGKQKSHKYWNPSIPKIIPLVHSQRERAQSQIRNYPLPWVMVYELWNAPITKFWVFQLFYIIYLSLFSVAVLFPRCGNVYLDLCVCLWTILIIVDLIRNTYLYQIKYTNVSIAFKIIEIAFQMIVVFVYISGRLLNDESYYLLNPYGEKIILSIALLYAYYTLFIVFLPISATLGPLLYRLKIMVLVDFLNFIRLSILVMVSFGVVIQATLYPDKALNAAMFKQAFHRSLMTLFTTPVDDLMPDNSCASQLRPEYSDTDETGRCTASFYADENCRNPFFWQYVFIICYLVLLKLILMTLLYAIFASSASSLTSDTDTIWKFQRYILVMDFKSRLPLPPPLNLFYYIFYSIRSIYRLFTNCCINIKKKESFTFDKLFSLRLEPKRNTLLTESDYIYMKSIANKCYTQHQNKINTDSISVLQWEQIQANTHEIEYEKEVLKQLKGKISDIERSVAKSLNYLESMKHLSAKKQD